MCIVFTWPKRPPIILHAGDRFSCLHMKSAAAGLKPSWVWAVSEGKRWGVTAARCLSCRSWSGNTVRRSLSCFFTESTLVWQNLWFLAPHEGVCVVARPGTVLQERFVWWWASANTYAGCRVAGFTFVAQIIWNVDDLITDNWELAQWVLQARSHFWSCIGCYFTAVQAATSDWGITASLFLFPLLPVACHPFSCASTAFQDQ